MSDLDRSLLRLLRTRGHAPPLEGAAIALSRSGEWGSIWWSSALVAAALDKPRRGRWLRAAALPTAAIGVNYAVKLAVRRPRPALRGLPPLAGAPSSLSFPSAHSTAAFAAATAFGRIAPRRRPLLYATATAMALSRPYLGMHYPSDVLAGAVFGTLLGALVPGLDGEDEPAPAKPR